MLDEKVDISLGCCIALVNAINNTEEYPKCNEHIQSCLYDIKKNQNLDQWIETLREDKKEVVPDCFVCMNPCGRVDEVSVNACKTDHKAQELLDNLEMMTFEEIFYTLGALPYTL